MRYTTTTMVADEHVAEYLADGWTLDPKPMTTAEYLADEPCACRCLACNDDKCKCPRG